MSHNVVVFDGEGFWRYVGRDLDAERAVETAKQYVDLADAAQTPLQIESIDRVMITDEEDFCNFLWERGKGIVYPPRRARA